MPKPTFLPTQCSVWDASVINQSKPGKTESKGFLETRHLKDLDRIDGEPTKIRMEKFPSIHYIENSR